MLVRTADPDVAGDDALPSIVVILDGVVVIIFVGFIFVGFIFAVPRPTASGLCLPASRGLQGFFRRVARTYIASSSNLK